MPPAKSRQQTSQEEMEDIVNQTVDKQLNQEKSKKAREKRGRSPDKSSSEESENSTKRIAILNSNPDVEDDASVALKLQLNEIDPKHQLSIYVYAKTRDTDPVIQEYVDKLLDLQFFPDKPSFEDIDNLSLQTTTTVLPDKCKAEVHSLLMSFLQESYFCHNMSEANQNSVAVIRVDASVKMPCFSLSPDLGLHRFTEVKKICALQFQAIAYDNARFIKELLFIRAAALIKLEVSSSIKNRVDMRLETQNHFNILFTSASTEFMKKFRIKEIDFKNKSDNIKHVTPTWRKNGQAPPSIPNNPYAKTITNIINSGKFSLDAISVVSDFKKLTEELERKAQFRESSSFSKNEQQSNVTHSTKTSSQYNFPGKQREFPSSGRGGSKGSNRGNSRSRGGGGRNIGLTRPRRENENSSAAPSTCNGDNSPLNGKPNGKTPVTPSSIFRILK